MSIRAVIFDFGGVLVRGEDYPVRREWEEYLGLAEGELFEAVFGTEVSDRAMVGAATEDDVWRHVAATFELSDEQIEEVRREFWTGESKDLDLVRFLQGLSPRYKTAILSNAWPRGRRVIAGQYNLDEAVDTLIISAEEGVAKPQRRIYEIAVERLGVELEEAVFVDDLIENIEGARDAGMRGVHFRDTAQTIAEVKGHLDETMPA